MGRADPKSGIYIAVGANISPETNILEAARLLRDSPGIHFVSVSTLYKTQAVGVGNAPPFINGVWRIATSIAPRPLKFEVLRSIEARLGRVRTADKFMPRPIDLDLILYNDETIASPDLVLPDPDIARYAHIAVPLLDISPSLAIKGTRESVSTPTHAGGGSSLEPLPSLTLQLKGIVNHG